MAIRDDILPLLKQHNWEACHTLLDGAAPNDDDERSSVTYWRAVVLQSEGLDKQALALLQAKRDEFACKCLPDYKIANILNRLGRPQEAIATLSKTPIFAEAEQFPGLAREAAYLYCTLLAENGGKIPPDVLSFIPDEFQTLDDKNRIMDKGDLLKLIQSQAKGAM
jgi:hypothetical protein